jgi:sigma-B regulation protein RsbU (phosphoserine phosphatase)
LSQWEGDFLMINKSIAYRLSIYISLAVTGVFLAFIVIAYYFNSNIIKKNIDNEAVNLGYKALILGEKQLISAREITSNVSDQALFFAQHNEVELFVRQLMLKYPFLNAMHVDIDSGVPNVKYRNFHFYRSSDSILIQKEDELIYCCKNEERMFEEIMAGENPDWTEVFNCERNEKQVVGFYSPIRIRVTENELVKVGSVITELSLSDLNDTINSFKIGKKDGYAFLVSADGTYLTHPNKEWILKRNLFTIKDEEYKVSEAGIDALLKNGETGSVIAYPEYLNYRKSWVHYTPIKETGWTLFFVVPYDELFVPLYLLILRMLFFSVLGILVIFFIITYISNKLIQPLSTITTQLKKFSSFSNESDSVTRNEVQLVSESLNYLKSWYEKFEINQHQEEILNSQRKQDLLEASEIQMSLIKTDFSVFSNRDSIDLYAIYKPARIVSGDLFDFFFLDDDNLFFSIGDVSGKGISAAFFMSVAQTLIKSNSKLKSPGKIVAGTNNELFTVNQHQFFLTLFAGVLNLKTGVLKYCNAAHTPTLILNSKGEISELNSSHGMPLGLYPNREYEDSMVSIEPGSSLILYSDGVTEMQDSDKMHFGNERLYQLLGTQKNQKPKEVIERIEKELDLFKGKMKQADDVTIMVLQFKSTKKA